MAIKLSDADWQPVAVRVPAVVNRPWLERVMLLVGYGVLHAMERLPGAAPEQIAAAAIGYTQSTAGQMGIVFPPWVSWGIRLAMPAAVALVAYVRREERGLEVEPVTPLAAEEVTGI